MFFIIFIVILIVVLYRRFRHTKIKFKTFFKKGFKPNRGVFGVYCYCGKQGSGKTYSVVEFLLYYLNYKVYANISTLRGIDYTYFNGMESLLELRNKKNCIIVYDEIFTILSKLQKTNPKQAAEVMDFLSQMRKRGIIFITTCQEWLELPMTFRRYCRYQIDCHMRTILGLGILFKHCYDAEHMKWSKDDNEYIAPLIETTISKCNIDVANSYDTFEQIKT